MLIIFNRLSLKFRVLTLLKMALPIVIRLRVTRLTVTPLTVTRLKVTPLIVSLLLLAPTNSYAKQNEKLTLSIVEPFLDFHTGPGKNYPVFYIAQYGESIEVQKRRNDWFKVTLEVSGDRIKTGWVHRNAIGLTIRSNRFPQLIADNKANSSEKNIVLAKDDPLLTTLFNPNLYFGFNYGQRASADVVGVHIGKQITDSFNIELQVDEFLGATAQGQTWAGILTFSPFPAWHLSPFTEIGAGSIHSKARGTNSQQNAGSNKFLQSGFGLQLRLSDRYRLRLEYRHLNVLTSNDNNGEIETWHIGFSGYF